MVKPVPVPKSELTAVLLRTTPLSVHVVEVMLAATPEMVTNAVVERVACRENRAVGRRASVVALLAATAHTPGGGFSLTRVAIQVENMVRTGGGWQLPSVTIANPGLQVMQEVQSRVRTA